MNNFELYKESKVDKNHIWLMFLLLGWSYGSMDEMSKQVFFYLTGGGCGIWVLYRLLTLNRAIRLHNHNAGIRAGLSFEELEKLDLKTGAQKNNYAKSKL
jgi:hypothetical protein